MPALLFSPLPATRFIPGRRVIVRGNRESELELIKALGDQRHNTTEDLPGDEPKLSSLAALGCVLTPAPRRIPNRAPIPEFLTSVIVMVLSPQFLHCKGARSLIPENAIGAGEPLD